MLWGAGDLILLNKGFPLLTVFGRLNQDHSKSIQLLFIPPPLEFPGVCPVLLEPFLDTTNLWVSRIIFAFLIGDGIDTLHHHATNRFKVGQGCG